MKALPASSMLRSAHTATLSLLKPKVLRKHWLRTLLMVAILCASLYWGVLASDRYVSEAHLVIDRTDTISQNGSGDLITMLTGSTASHDVLLFKDRLLSVDMMRELDQKLGLRNHYSDHKRDLISRLWSKDASDETFHDYYLSRVTVTYDDYSQVLTVKAQAYTPAMAQAIARLLVDEGENEMNKQDNTLAQEQVDFIEKQLVSIRKRMADARQQLLAFQNGNGLVSPSATVESVSEVVARLEGERANLTAQKRAMEGYLTPAAPDMVQIDSQIAALQQQIGVERGRLAAKKGAPLNKLAEQQERLQADAAFTEDVYKTALAALEKARLDATRKIKSVSILQSANLPQDSIEPRRLYNIAAFTIVALLVTGVIYLLGAIIRDHRD